MTKCAYCGGEAADDAATCPGCGTALDRSTTPPVDPQLKDPAFSMVIVATFRTVVDAGMLRTRLEAAGIEACIPEEYNPQIFWSAVPSPLERVTVRVAAKDYEAAKEIAEEV